MLMLVTKKTRKKYFSIYTNTICVLYHDFFFTAQKWMTFDIVIKLLHQTCGSGLRMTRTGSNTKNRIRTVEIGSASRSEYNLIHLQALKFYIFQISIFGKVEIFEISQVDLNLTHLEKLQFTRVLDPDPSV